MRRRILRGRTRVHLLSFYTEGPPNDAGSDLTGPARELENAAKPFFDSILFATPRQLIRADASWRVRLRDMSEEITGHPEFESSLRWQRGWARLGLFSWKPRLILHRLLSSDVASEDIVLYHDSDCSKYPEYLRGIPRWGPWLRRIMKGFDVLVFRDNRARLVSDTKPELWEQFFREVDVRDLKHLWAGAVAVRKTAAGVGFIRKWDTLAKDFGNLSPITRAAGETGFAQHAPDQAILTCLRHCRREWPEGFRLREVYLRGLRTIPPKTKITDSESWWTGIGKIQ